MNTQPHRAMVAYERMDFMAVGAMDEDAQIIAVAHASELENGPLCDPFNASIWRPACVAAPPVQRLTAFAPASSNGQSETSLGRPR